MARFTQSPKARLELIELWKYIAAKNGNTRADDFLDRIMGKLELLAESPGVGKPRDELRIGLRSF